MYIKGSEDGFRIQNVGKKHKTLCSFFPAIISSVLQYLTILFQKREADLHFLFYNEYLNYYQSTDLLPFTRAAVADNHHK